MGDGLTVGAHAGAMAEARTQLEIGFRAGVAELLAAIPALDDVLSGLSPEGLHRHGHEGARHALAPLVWRAVAGDVLTTEQVRELLQVSRQALHKRVEAGTLLGLPAERTTLYPTGSSLLRERCARPSAR